jgi:hypothetical protein
MSDAEVRNRRKTLEFGFLNSPNSGGFGHHYSGNAYARSAKKKGDNQELWLGASLNAVEMETLKLCRRLILGAREIVVPVCLQQPKAMHFPQSGMRPTRAV